ncbi:2-dehydro-3-deoxygalactonokinase [Roseomonas marmotae]|uniref:2-dehydro-3-deoxygalactonokinase n=1 Tax=Roseomonas marmotae TaxID=2768161 RepID=A0ABS3KCQ3_9PROT|nr:2-dehydro-3-deoxygalactonokinase [Roseomonas marmotae]MBO1074136.1 2-dehydro-3-deoxygalactonokinase [Roseomonas marmotae]QTI78916.1 2-dehydro-3-deoxygalactonokinase [Roseomonas marmotae]
MIGVDWGTSSFRAWRMDNQGGIKDRVAAPRGILTVEAGGFPAVLRSLIGPWLDDGENIILICGMAGSRQGWQEAPYLPCPADAAALAGALLPVEFEGRRCFLVPGLSARDPQGVPEVMRGEETKILGLLDRLPPGRSLVLSPGSHSKWALVQDGTVLSFLTQFTGEAYAVLSTHTILARTLDATAPQDWAAFDDGLARARQPGGLLHHLFGLRTRNLFGELTEAAAGSYLSGLLLGHEVASALPEGMTRVFLVGDGAMMARYARALASLGVATTEVPEEAAAAGLWRIGQSLPAL